MAGSGRSRPWRLQVSLRDEIYETRLWRGRGWPGNLLLYRDQSRAEIGVGWGQSVAVEKVRFFLSVTLLDGLLLPARSCAAIVFCSVLLDDLEPGSRRPSFDFDSILARYAVFARVLGTLFG